MIFDTKKYPYLYQFIAWFMKISNNKAKKLIREGGVQVIYEKTIL